MAQTTGVQAVVFVADAQRRLAGTVSLAALMQAPANATLASLMRPPEALLPAFTPLAAVSAHPGWERASVLPVVETGDRLVGVITRDALARALRRVPRTAPLQGADSLPGLLAAGYWQALSAALQATLALLPSVPRLTLGEPAEVEHTGADRA